MSTPFPIDSLPYYWKIDVLDQMPVKRVLEMRCLSREWRDAGTASLNGRARAIAPDLICTLVSVQRLSMIPEFPAYNQNFILSISRRVGEVAAATFSSMRDGIDWSARCYRLIRDYYIDPEYYKGDGSQWCSDIFRRQQLVGLLDIYRQVQLVGRIDGVRLQDPKWIEGWLESLLAGVIRSWGSNHPPRGHLRAPVTDVLTTPGVYRDLLIALIDKHIPYFEVKATHVSANPKLAEAVRYLLASISRPLVRAIE